MATTESYARVQSDNGTPTAYHRDRKFFRRAHTGRIANAGETTARIPEILRMQRCSRDAVLIADGKIQIEIKAPKKLYSVQTETVYGIRYLCIRYTFDSVYATGRLEKGDFFVARDRYDFIPLVARTRDTFVITVELPSPSFFRNSNEHTQTDSKRKPPKDFISSPSPRIFAQKGQSRRMEAHGEKERTGCNERKSVPVEISRRKLSVAIVRRRLSVQRGRKMKYEMKRRGGVGGGPRRSADETRAMSTGEGMQVGERESERVGQRK